MTAHWSFENNYILILAFIYFRKTQLSLILLLVCRWFKAKKFWKYFRARDLFEIKSNILNINQYIVFFYVSYSVWALQLMISITALFNRYLCYLYYDTDVLNDVPEADPALPAARQRTRITSCDVPPLQLQADQSRASSGERVPPGEPLHPGSGPRLGPQASAGRLEETPDQRTRPGSVPEEQRSGSGDDRQHHLTLPALHHALLRTPGGALEALEERLHQRRRGGGDPDAIARVLLPLERQQEPGGEHRLLEDAGNDWKRPPPAFNHRSADLLQQRGAQ